MNSNEVAIIPEKETLAAINSVDIPILREALKIASQYWDENTIFLTSKSLMKVKEGRRELVGQIVGVLGSLATCIYSSFDPVVDIPYGDERDFKPRFQFFPKAWLCIGNMLESAVELKKKFRIMESKNVLR